MVLIVLTANRGLCGGFNHNMISMAEKVLAKHRKENEWGFSNRMLDTALALVNAA